MNQLGKLTAALYLRKAVRVGEFWGIHVEHFLLEKLLEPLDWDAKFPSIAPYVAAVTTTGNGLLAIKVYKHKIDFCVEVFEER